MKPDPDCAWVYSYVRFSSAGQEQGDSLRRQTALLDSWMKRNPHLRLDKSQKAWDGKATSGFSAEHRLNPKYALAQFEARVKQKLVAPGSYLVVENLDRLTREHWSDAVPYILSLISKGIRIVQLSPAEIVYDSEMDQGRLMLLLMEVGRAHGESKLKSERLKEAWERKRAAAAEGKPRGGKLPGWIEMVEGDYRLKPAAAAAVRLIYRLSTQGLGGTAIVRHLVDNSIAPIVGTRWTKSYICHVLCNRSAIGEHQPHSGHRYGRKPIGNPIPNHFPAVVTEAEFYAARNAITARVGRTGRPGRKSKTPYAFAGLMRSAVDGSKLIVSMEHGRPKIISSAAQQAQPGARWIGVRLDHFTDAVLARLQELTTGSLFGDNGDQEVDELRGKLHAAADRLVTATARWESDPLSLAWQEQVTKWDREQRAVAEQLRQAEQKAASPASATWSEALKLMKQNDPVRLRQCLLETVSVIWVLIVPVTPSRRMVAVQVKFHGGAERQYLIASTTPTGMAARTQQGRWACYDLVGKVPGGFDLSNRKQAAKLTRLLEKLNLDTF